MSIIVNKHITFKNSLQFHNSSLDTLTSNLEDSDFKHLTYAELVILMKNIVKHLKINIFLYLGMNDLYGHAMSQYSPYANFK